MKTKIAMDMACFFLRVPQNKLISENRMSLGPFGEMTFSWFWIALSQVETHEGTCWKSRFRTEYFWMSFIIFIKVKTLKVLNCRNITYLYSQLSFKLRYSDIYSVYISIPTLYVKPFLCFDNYLHMFPNDLKWLIWHHDKLTKMAPLSRIIYD